MTKWEIEPHGGMDKWFKIAGPLDLEIDYDDVNHPVVDILAEAVVACLNEHFETPMVWYCAEPNDELEIEQPGRSSWDTLMCHQTMLMTHGNCPVCGGPTIKGSPAL